jgi:hypothetical protein
MKAQIGAPASHSGHYRYVSQSNSSHLHNQYEIDYERLKDKSRPHTLALLQRVLPEGRLERNEYVARNPRRPDKCLGSFKFNINNHKWQDFATKDKGGDIISLWAYVKGIRQIDAAREILAIVGGV